MDARRGVRVREFARTRKAHGKLGNFGVSSGGGHRHAVGQSPTVMGGPCPGGCSTGKTVRRLRGKGRRKR